MSGGGLFFGGSAIAAVVAGMVALFAPCCISVMLPAYFATSFQNRRVLVAMTFLFAAGVATVILPLALGVNVLRQVFASQHTLIYMIGGGLMLLLGLYVLAGGELHLPMPGRRAGNRVGPLSVYSLGLFSGIASSCCAPVLIGVIALSGIASSFPAALGLGLAYVFGMVAPLFVIALLWERIDWKAHGFFRPRSFTFRFGSVQRTISATNIITGVLLVAIGVLTIAVGIGGESGGPTSGLQAEISIRQQHIGTTMTQALGWVPSWVVGLVLLLAVALLARRALREVGTPAEEECETPMPTGAIADHGGDR
jgi:cytochrome c-type biogenesis protein